MDHCGLKRSFEAEIGIPQDQMPHRNIEQLLFMPIARSIARKELRESRQPHKVFMAGNNQNSNHFTVMLGGCCVLKCLPMFVQNLSDFGTGLRPN